MTKTNDTTVVATVAAPIAALVDSQITAANRVLSSSMVITIDSPEMYEIAVDQARVIESKLAALEEERFKITRPMDAAKKAVMELFAKPQSILELARAHLRPLITGYVVEQDRKRRAEQDEIDRKASEDRQAAADRQREEERKAAELLEKAAAAKPAQAAKLILAAEQATQRAQDAADAVELADIAPSRQVATAAPMAAGIGTRQTWKATVVDKVLLIKAAAADPERYAAYLEIDLVKLNALAKSMKGEARLPGVTFAAEAGISLRKK